MAGEQYEWRECNESRICLANEKSRYGRVKAGIYGERPQGQPHVRLGSKHEVLKGIIAIKSTVSRKA